MLAMSTLVMLGSTAGTEILWAQGRNDIITQKDRVAPDGNGTYDSFLNPVLGNSGQVAFIANLGDTVGGTDDNTGVFLGNGAGIAQIVRKGDAAPVDGRYSSFNNLLVNSSGQTAFHSGLASTPNDEGVFAGSIGGVSQLFGKGQSAPDNNGTYSGFGALAFNDFGQVATLGFLSDTIGGSLDDRGVFLGDGNSMTQIARAGQAAGGNGAFSSFGNARLNNSGQVAFWSTLVNTIGGNNDNSGIYRGSGGLITQIAREGQAAPDGNGVFSGFNSNSLAFNDWGQAAFSASLANTSGGDSDNQGIFRGVGQGLTQIVRSDQLAPDGNGRFTGFGEVVLNNLGQTAFYANLTGNNGNGIFVGIGDSLTQVARAGQFAPDGNGAFSNFGNLVLNDAGQSVFSATLTGTSGGNSDNSGIFTGDGIDFLKVIRAGDSLAGSTVTSVSLATEGFLNEHGQVAYRAELLNGNELISRWTPELHWRHTFGGGWNEGWGWTLGLTPAAVHDVFIDTASSVTVLGPVANTAVRSLQIGGGSGMATLELRNGATLTSTSGVTIAATGTLTGDGRIAGNVINNGNVRADNVTVVGTLTNHSVIDGHGRIHANLSNSASGEIRALTGDTLRLTGGSFSNSGLVEVHGGELRVTANLQNHSGSGLISVRDGSLIANSGINNSGSIAMSHGVSTLRGDIANTGMIQVSGGAHATFFDDVTQNGTMQVSSVGNNFSTAVFLGAFTGSGGFTGGGDVFALGDLRPGNSPASVLYDGNLFLGSSTDTFIELGGLGFGEFDQMIVTGDLNLAGDLMVSLIDGHTLGAGQQYLIGDVGGLLSGRFNGLDEGALVGIFNGQETFISYSGGGGNDIVLFTAVPEPSSLFVVTLAASVVALRRRPRTP
jgi:hypothetical protein